MTATSIVRDSLQALYDQHGKLTPELVVDEARAETHPLHDRFEWDDSVAAEAHRKAQAAALIRSVKVTFPTANNEVVKVRAYLPVTGKGYQRVEQIDDKEAIKAQMRKDIAWLTSKYRHLDEFWSMLAAESQRRAA